MILKIRFCDNDFRSVVNEACESLMYELMNGGTGTDGIKRYEEFKQKHGIENVKRALVMSSYGYLIARDSVRIYNEINYDFSEQEHLIKYFDENITVEEIKSFKEEWENGEVCYIDFYNEKVYLQ